MEGVHRVMGLGREWRWAVIMEYIGGHLDASGVLKSRPAPLHKILTGVPQVPAEVGLPEVNLIFIEHRVRCVNIPTG